jgi:hypothetical protein
MTLSKIKFNHVYVKTRDMHASIFVNSCGWFPGLPKLALQFFLSNLSAEQKITCLHISWATFRLSFAHV